MERENRATSFQCCFICGQWGFGRHDVIGTILCVDCENDVSRAVAALGGRRGKAEPQRGTLERPSQAGTSAVFVQGELF